MCFFFLVTTVLGIVNEDANKGNKDKVTEQEVHDSGNESVTDKGTAQHVG